MKSSPKRFGFVLLAVLLTSSVLMAVDIPLTNWTVPPYHASGSQGGITTMTDVTPGTGFVGVAPCRLVDTRIATMPNLSHPDVWLEIETNDTEAAAAYLRVHSVPRRDEVEQLREDFNGFWISDPAGVIHLVVGPEEV